MNAIKLVGGMSLCAVLTGCVAGADSDVMSEDPTYTETAVRLNADGTQTVTTRTITLSEELRENTARDRLANQAGVPAVGTERIGTASEEVITQNTSCPGSSFWLYDQVNRVGNKICYSGTGNIDLSNQYYCPAGSIYCSLWNDIKKSYYSGVDSGFFSESDGPVRGADLEPLHGVRHQSDQQYSHQLRGRGGIPFPEPRPGLPGTHREHGWPEPHAFDG
jgi:hypothetical protein